MNTRSIWMSGALLSALVIGMLGMPEADAHGKGGHSGGHAGGGGHAPRPPHVSAPRQNYKAPSMARAASASRGNNVRSQAMARGTQGRTHNNTQAHASNTQTHANNARVHTNTAQARTTNGQANTNHAAAVSTRSSVLGTTSPSTTSTGTTGTRTGNTFFPNTASTTGTRTGNTFFPNTYSYGTGAGTRAYRAYGYGRGYRNSYYGSRYGYGRSQGNNRAIISRLRSVHSSLARIDHDYQGHRVRSMHAISMAVRQLSSRSMNYNNTGFGAGMNNGQAMGMGMQGGRGMRQGGGFGRQGQPMSQAQSDSRMSQNLRTLQGINMQLTNQGYNTTGHARARGHVQQAIHELNVALSVR